MKYKNTKTGAVIDSPCVIKGGDWIEWAEQEVNEIQTEKVNEEVDEVEKIEEVEEEPEKVEDFDGITKKEIMQELDAFGIEYNPRAKKQELYDLMLGK